VALGIAASVALAVAGLAVSDSLPGAGDAGERVREQVSYSGPPADQGLLVQQGHGADIAGERVQVRARYTGPPADQGLIIQQGHGADIADGSAVLAERAPTSDRMDWLYWEAMNLTPPASGSDERVHAPSTTTPRCVAANAADCKFPEDFE
jgi:hypothetical protein